MACGAAALAPLLSPQAVAKRSAARSELVKIRGDVLRKQRVIWALVFALRSLLAKFLSRRKRIAMNSSTTNIRSNLEIHGRGKLRRVFGSAKLLLMKPSRSFASDNNATVHPEVLEAIRRANYEHVVGYGDDPHTESAVGTFREQIGSHT